MIGCENIEIRSLTFCSSVASARSSPPLRRASPFTQRPNRSVASLVEGPFLRMSALPVSDHFYVSVSAFRNRKVARPEIIMFRYRNLVIYIYICPPLSQLSRQLLLARILPLLRCRPVVDVAAGAEPSAQTWLRCRRVQRLLLLRVTHRAQPARAALRTHRRLRRR